MRSMTKMFSAGLGVLTGIGAFAVTGVSAVTNQPSLVVSVGWGHHRYRHPEIAVLNPERDKLSTQIDRPGTEGAQPVVRVLLAWIRGPRTVRMEAWSPGHACGSEQSPWLR